MSFVDDVIAGEVLAERERQDAKWGEQNHNLTEYFCILSEEVGEVAKAVVEYWAEPIYATRNQWLEGVRKELVQTAAVAVAMIGRIDRMRGDA